MGRFDSRTCAKSEWEHESGKHIPIDAEGVGTPNIIRLAMAYFPLLWRKLLQNLRSDLLDACSIQLVTHLAMVITFLEGGVT